MRDVLSKALGQANDEGETVDRILAAAFFRKRPLQAGTTPVTDLGTRRMQRSEARQVTPTAGRRA